MSETQTDRVALTSFKDHPWGYEEARQAVLERAFGVRAVDGDTIDAVVDVGYRIPPILRHRLAGIDTCEIHGVPKESEEFRLGKLAQERVEELVVGRPLLIRSGEDTGKYGRWISEVWVEVTESSRGRRLSDLLREEGHAKEDALASVS